MGNFKGLNIKKQGRSNGIIRVRRRGGGVSSKHVFSDTYGNLLGIPYKVLVIGVNNNLRLGIVMYSCGIVGQVYISDGVKVGDILINFDGENYSTLTKNLGSTCRLCDVEVGAKVSFIESFPGSGYKYCRSNGSYGIILKHIDYLGCTIVKMRSGILKSFFWNSRCVIGQVNNIHDQYDFFYKAGQSRLIGKRPSVRGVAMNPVDHPHGGGEGKTSGGRHPVSPWGQLSKGYKTRKKVKKDLIIK